MLVCCSTRGSTLRLQRSVLLPYTVLAHTKSCPTQKPKGPVCPGSSGKGTGKGVCAGSKGSGSGGTSIKVPDFKRAERSAPVRYGFIPENCFLFFHPITGVSGPYLFGVAVGNYLLSKEIYVMEHEYYLGLSIAVVIYYVTTRMGPAIGKSLDKECDAVQAEWEKGRTDEKALYQAAIKAAEDAKTRAAGQKLLMDAKKQNIAMQLEAVYRERMMLVYRNTKGRMDYHVKKYRAEAKIHQKWMIGWILHNVRKSITPEFEKQALDAAIRDLAAVAGKAK